MPGDTGEAVRDVQRRLAHLGFDVSADEPGTYGPATEAAARAFQAQRNLPVDGECGPVTWAALVEAGWRLGDRLLYLRSPMLRGDDVAELQRRLNELGFDVGRVDGILGPDTERATKDFQRNTALTCDGVVGPETRSQIDRFGSHAGEATPRGGVAAVRERELLRCAPRTLAGRRIAVGNTGGLDVLAEALGRALREGGATVLALEHPDPSAHATAANEAGVDVYLGVATVSARASESPESPACTAAYYATRGYESPGGCRLAALIVDALGPVFAGGSCAAQGMSLPILRETRMPAVLCRVSPPQVIVQHTGDIARRLAHAVTVWASQPLDN